MKISRSELCRIIHYNPYTGVFTWRVKPGKNIPAGVRAGSKRAGGYRAIKIHDIMYSESHLAWFYTYGYWPKQELDHINRVPSDNRLCNLRAASSAQNHANTLVRAHNKLGVKGVRMMPSGRFKTGLCYRKQRMYLGSFDTLDEAKAAHDAKHRELYGKFSPAHNPRP